MNDYPGEAKIIRRAKTFQRLFDMKKELYGFFIQDLDELTYNWCIQVMSEITERIEWMQTNWVEQFPSYQFKETGHTATIKQGETHMETIKRLLGLAQNEDVRELLHYVLDMHFAPNEKCYPIKKTLLLGTF